MVFTAVFLCSLEATEEKFRNRESRPEDLQVIAELKDMVSEREALVKKLVVGTRRGALRPPAAATYHISLRKLLRRREAPISCGARIPAVLMQMRTLILDALLLHL